MPRAQALVRAKRRAEETVRAREIAPAEGRALSGSRPPLTLPPGARALHGPRNPERGAPGSTPGHHPSGLRTGRELAALGTGLVLTLALMARLGSWATSLKEWSPLRYSS